MPDISPESAAETPSFGGHTFVFVVHGGPLEIKSALLACSLRQKLVVGQRIVAVEMKPDTKWGAISPQAKALFDELNVERIPSENEIDLDYPHGNKINSMAKIDGPAIFLDSDMLMMRPFINHHSLLGVDAALKAADIDTFVRGGGGWSRAYDIFGLPLPERTLLATATGEKMRPYYNAGFVCVKNGAEFSKCWLETSQIIDADSTIHNKRPWLDQVALPVALMRLGWKVGDASIDLNYPAHLGIWKKNLPYIVHYHSPEVIHKNAQLRGDVKFYCAKYPDLKAIFDTDPAFLSLLD